MEAIGAMLWTRFRRYRQLFSLPFRCSKGVDDGDAFTLEDLQRAVPDMEAEEVERLFASLAASVGCEPRCYDRKGLTFRVSRQPHASTVHLEAVVSFVLEMRRKREG